MSVFFALILSILAIFLILLVLVQRGRGGGLAGALGGMGGSSAFGAKAGDVFTRITIITASIWIAISILVFFWAKHRGDPLGRADGPSRPASGPLDTTQPKSDGTSATTTAPAATTDAPPATDTPLEEAAKDTAEANSTATQKLESDKAGDAPAADTKN